MVLQWLTKTKDDGKNLPLGQASGKRYSDINFSISEESALVHRLCFCNMPGRLTKRYAKKQTQHVRCMYTFGLVPEQQPAWHQCALTLYIGAGVPEVV